MASPRLLTVFGATGNQGGSVIDLILADPALRAKYKLRGITRHTSSSSAKALTEKGVEMVAANLNDLDSLRSAMRGSYSVFGVTNFWDKDVMSKVIEIQQGKNIFEACQAEQISHLVFSTLPHASVLTNGELQHIDHFDGKAVVAEHIESNKQTMTASYFLPAMYLKSYKDQVMVLDGSPQMVMPPPLGDRVRSHGIWPVLDARGDSGKYIVGLLEAGDKADGARAHGVSVWTTQQELLAAFNKASGSKITYHEAEPAELQKLLPAAIAQEVGETMQLVVDYEYYGLGAAKMQAISDRWLYDGQETLGLEDIMQGSSLWNFQR